MMAELILTKLNRLAVALRITRNDGRGYRRVMEKIGDLR